MANRQQARREICEINESVDLETLLKPQSHEDNSVTKKEIFEHLNKQQCETINFHHEGREGLTWQDLDPRLNRYGSVRYQMLKNSGHMLKETNRKWNCEVCGEIFTNTIVYFISFGDNPKTIMVDKVRPDDILMIGQKGTTHGHMFDAHPEEAQKRLAKMGVKLQ